MTVSASRLLPVRDDDDSLISSVLRSPPQFILSIIIDATKAHFHTV